MDADQRAETVPVTRVRAVTRRPGRAGTAGAGKWEIAFFSTSNKVAPQIRSTLERLDFTTGQTGRFLVLFDGMVAAVAQIVAESQPQ